MERRKPPTKVNGQAVGARRIDGVMMDIASGATFLGETENTLRSQVARRTVPFRKLGGRIVFLRSELEEFLSKLPGVTVDEALEAVKARQTAETALDNLEVRR